MEASLCLGLTSTGKLEFLELSKDVLRSLDNQDLKKANVIGKLMLIVLIQMLPVKVFVVIGWLQLLILT